MSLFKAGWIKPLLLTAILAFLAGCSGQHDRLQRLVTGCLDISGEDYCRSCPWPRTESSCIPGQACRSTTEVWRENTNYVAIRDRKMCGCSDPAFVHGLVIPRALISGVEAASRPEGIWDFAWQTALRKNIPESEIALGINPRHDRSENQMHIHITRLRKGATDGHEKELAADIPALDSVWATARRVALSKGLDDYGILVVQRKTGGFTVIVEPGSPEDRYMAARCPGP